MTSKGEIAILPRKEYEALAGRRTKVFSSAKSCSRKAVDASSSSIVLDEIELALAAVTA
jgi:hypothetical protein